MSDEARRTPEVGSASPGLSTIDKPISNPLGSGVTVAGRAPSGGEWGELSDAVFSIWTRPRETIRRIVNVNPRYGVVLLAALSGSSATLMRLPGEDAPSFGLLVTLILACTLGPLFGIAVLWISAWIVRGLGHWLLGGQATPEEMRAALAWAEVPQVATLPIALLTTVLGAPVVTGMGSAAVAFVLLAVAALLIVCAFWGLIIICNTVAEVQGYASAWKGLWNLLLPGVIVALVGIVAAIVIPLALRA